METSRFGVCKDTLKSLPNYKIAQGNRSISGNYKVLYNEITDYENAFYKNEAFWGVPMSLIVKDAREHGYKTKEEFLEYQDKMYAQTLAQAIRTNTSQLYDQFGPLACQAIDECYNWDIVYEMITPLGEHKFIRVHLC